MFHLNEILLPFVISFYRKNITITVIFFSWYRFLILNLTSYINDSCSTPLMNSLLIIGSIKRCQINHSGKKCHQVIIAPIRSDDCKRNILSIISFEKRKLTFIYNFVKLYIKVDY